MNHKLFKKLNVFSNSCGFGSHGCGFNHSKGDNLSILQLKHLYRTLNYFFVANYSIIPSKDEES